MKKTVFTALMAATAIGATAQDATFEFFKYEGNDARFKKNIDESREYLNPILAGFYPDPSFCKKGDTFYLVNSSFAFFPGVPIFESQDLVNWKQIGHVLDRESQLQLPEERVSGGIYAPAISYNKRNQTFYMITTNVGRGGNFYVKTKDPHQGWSDPIYLPKVDGIDPSFLFDDDGKAYIVHNAPVFGTADYEGQRAIRLLRFDVKGDSIIGDPIEIVRGGTHVTERPIWIEGPHLYHIGKYYYLMCAEGGTAEDHSEVIFRAKNPMGPWEECPMNPILTQRSGLSDDRAEKVTCTGHADLLEVKKGEWWAVFLGCRPYEGNLYNTGRETFLLPVTWKDGWPIILESGKAVPTVGQRSARPAGTLARARTLNAQHSTLRSARRDACQSKNTQQTTGNFTYIDRFDSDRLSLRWMFLRNPPANAYTLTSEGLTLHPSEGTVREKKPLSALFFRQQHATFSAETTLRFTPKAEGQLAGFTLFQSERHHFVFGKTLLNGRQALVLKRMENEEVLVGSCFLDDNGPLRLKVEADGRYYSFYFATADGAWQPLARGVDGANLSTAHAGGFIGTGIGLLVER